MTVYVLDLETTGTDPWSDAPVSFALYAVTPGRHDLVASGRCNPGRPIDPGASEVHGITDADVEQAAPWLDVARELHAATRDVRAWAAYNAPFDLTMLFRAWRDLGLPVPRVPVLCGLVWARALWPSKRERERVGLPNLKLGSVCTALGVTLHGAHDAAADGLATVRVLVELKARLVAAGKVRHDVRLADLGRWTVAHGIDTDLWFLDRFDDGAGLRRTRERLGSDRTGPAQPDETAWMLMRSLMNAEPVARAVEAA